MKPKCSGVYKEGKRISLQVLQPAGGDKENLVGGSRQPISNMKVGAKLRDKGKRNNKVNEKVIEHSTVKGNLKKRKVANKLTQTQINIRDHTEDLTSEGDPSSADYWKLLAEERRIALVEALEENKNLHETVQLLKEEKERADYLLEESRTLVEVLNEIVAGEDEARDDSEDESSS